MDDSDEAHMSSEEEPELNAQYHEEEEEITPTTSVPHRHGRKHTRHLAHLSSEEESEVNAQDHKEEEEITPTTSALYRHGRKKTRHLSAQVNELMEEVKKTNTLMLKLAKKWKKHDSRFRSIEEQLNSSTRVVETTPSRSSKKDVPTEVRVSYISTDCINIRSI